MPIVSVESILDIISSNDPMGLLEMGAPDDEYEDEALAIASILDECRNVQELNEKVFEIFTHFFGDTLDGADKLEQISQEIWNSCQ